MAFLIYLLKVNVAVILFYGFYRLLFQQDTLLRWRRGTLLALIFISLLYPFVDITRQFVNNQHFQEAVRNGFLTIYTLPEVVIFKQGAGQSVSFVHSLPQLLVALYGIIAVILFFRLLIQTGIIIGMVNNAQTIELYGRTVHQHRDVKMPFSFFRWIVLNPALYTDMELKEILRHEETHVRESHSVDILLAELLCVFCWFNPFVWLLKREIRMNLEFLADRSVLASGCEAEHYQFHLLRLTYHKAATKIVNNFNVSLLKKRIFMMNKKQTSKQSIFKYTLLIPIAATLVFFSNTFKMQAGAMNSFETTGTGVMAGDTETLRNPEIQDTIVSSSTAKSKAEPDIFLRSGKDIFSHVETPPQFPGGDKALMEYISANLKYPESAIENKIEGRVIVRFVINSEGLVEDIAIQRSLDPACDREAIRIVENMPAWEPGKQSGNPVNVYYTLPILFKLTPAQRSSEIVQD
jgi:TonB family protein